MAEAEACNGCMATQDLADGLSAHEAWAGPAHVLVRGPDQLTGQGSRMEWQALIR